MENLPRLTMGAMTRPMTDKTLKPVHIIGAGLAGSEAAWLLHEMRPHRATDAHQTDGLAELVCSNSFRSDDAENNAVGLLHEEMRRAGSLILAAADATRCRRAARWPSTATASPRRHRELEAASAGRRSRASEVDGLPPSAWDSVIVATGPLTSPALWPRRS
jgi:methylenetetrahydrofolate--tRNA-(uracil-5-)-methyltransferase